MSTQNNFDNWWNENGSIALLWVCVFATCVTELQVVTGIWIKPHQSYTFLAFFVPVYVLLPVLVGFAGRKQIRALAAAGEMSAHGAKKVQTLFIGTVLIACMGLGLLSDVAFSR